MFVKHYSCMFRVFFYGNGLISMKCSLCILQRNQGEEMTTQSTFLNFRATSSADVSNILTCPLSQCVFISFIRLTQIDYFLHFFFDLEICLIFPVKTFCTSYLYLSFLNCRTDLKSLRYQEKGIFFCILWGKKKKKGIKVFSKSEQQRSSIFRFESYIL